MYSYRFQLFSPLAEKKQKNVSFPLTTQNVTETIALPNTPTFDDFDAEGEETLLSGGSGAFDAGASLLLLTVFSMC